MNSEWFKTEIAKARQREVREKRQVLFPIRLVDYETIQQWECFDADTGKDSEVVKKLSLPTVNSLNLQEHESYRRVFFHNLSAREIREYFIPNFSNWKSHDAYQ